MQKTTGKKRRGLTLQKKEAITGWLFVTPAMVGFLIFTAFSMVYSLYISFTNWNILSDPAFVGFQNYRNLFTRDIFFWDYLWNTFYYVLVLVPSVLVISLFFAILLNRRISGLTSFYRASLFLPCVISTVAIALVARTTADLCRDAGESALAAAVETAGTVCALAAALPLLRTVMELLTELMA